jgi:hypothetical protein
VKRFAVIIMVVAGLSVLAVYLAVHQLTRRRHSVETLMRQRGELKDALANLQTNLNQRRPYWYYAFREVEEPDERAWTLAVRKVDAEIAEKSNVLVRVERKLSSADSSKVW